MESEHKMKIVFAFLITLCYTNAEPVVVRIEQGLLKGRTVKRFPNNEIYYSFKGIPYAAPPVGELRFMAPRPPLSWTGERDARVHGAKCPQIKLVSELYTHYCHEDCLFLNIYTPSLKPKNPLPVMFYIHGGYFISGSGNEDQFGPDYLMDRNVVLVTINYRLGTLGFLSLDIDEVPGNAGLKDQVAALQWVQKNIATFGGDPSNVTIFGQSSGAASVSLHLLSPMSKGLFNRAIAMSGVFLKDFDLPFEHKRRALLLSKELGMYTQDPMEAFQFLQNASVKSLVQADPIILFSEIPRRDLLEFFYFRPVVEKDFGGEHFLLEDPQKLLSENKTNNVELILGHTTAEGIYRASTQKKYVMEYLPNYRELFVPARIANVLDQSSVLGLADRIQTHYFGDKEISEDTMKEVFTFYSYFYYIHHIQRFLEMWTKIGNKAYYYVFSYFGNRNLNGKYGLEYGLTEATHGDDIPYIFKNNKLLPRLQEDSDEYKMIVQTCTLLTNFAKYGNPTPNNSLGTIWLDYSQNNSYLDINYNLTLKSNPDEEEINFWRQIYELAGFKFS